MRHLFRHLDNAGRLRENPLVSQFFASPDSGGELCAASAQIRSLVMLAAEDYRKRATSSSERIRRDRQFAIVREHCVGQKALSQLAGELGISVRQCYRERAEIFNVIGTSLRSCEPSRPSWLERTSEFQLQMERAAVHIEAGNFDRALQVYEEVAAAADLPRKIDAAFKMADLDLELGKYSDAQAQLSALAAMLDAPTAVQSRDLSCARVEWLKAKLAWETGDFEEFAQRISRVRTSLPRVREGSRDFKAVRAEVELESALRAMDRGEFPDAQRHLDEAATICGRDPELKLSSFDVLLAQIILNRSRMRPGDGASLQEHACSMNRAVEIAASLRSTKRRLVAATHQVRNRSAVDDPQREVEGILASARRFANKRLLAILSLMLADYLLVGRHWRTAGPLLRCALPKGSYLWATLMHLRGVFLLRIGDPYAARKCAKLALGVAQRAYSPRLIATALRGVAMSAYLTAREQEARDYVEAAIPIAERYGSLRSCLKTYRYAALITGRRKYARQAEKFGRALGA